MACSKDCHTVAGGAVRVCLSLQMITDSDDADSFLWEHEFVDLESEFGRQFEPDSSRLVTGLLLGCDG